jgi:indolepyruvate ferredoxin oxidoreductase
VQLASLPDKIRGFGHIKESSIRQVAAERTRLRERLHPAPVAMAAE